MNNDPAWVAQQHLQLGVCAAIVDDVAGVVGGLRRHMTASPALPVASNIQSAASLEHAAAVQQLRQAVRA